MKSCDFERFRKETVVYFRKRQPWALLNGRGEKHILNPYVGFPGGSEHKATDLGSIPGLGRSPGEGNGPELPEVQASFRNGRGTRDQIANIHWILKKKEFQKNIYFCFIDYAKAFDCVDHNKLWKILQEMGIPDHLTCLLRNLYAGQEVIVRTGHGTTNGFQIGKGVHQGCILSPCLYNFYAEYIMRNTGLEEAQAGIKIAGRNINNLRYADDTTLMAESEELKSLLMKVKEESEKAGLKLNIQKTKIMASSPIT